MMTAGNRKSIAILLATGLLAALASAAAPQDDRSGTPVDIRLGGGLRIIRVKPGNRSAPQFRGATTSAMPTRAASSFDPAESLAEPAEASEATLYIHPPLFGFSPKVAVTLTDKKKRMFDQDMTHVLAPAGTSDIGYSLNPPAEDNFVIGILDSGANAHVIADPYSAALGLSGSHLTNNYFEAGGVGGTLGGYLSYPIGLFVAGLDAVQNNGQLDVSRIVGHYNVSVFASEGLDCGQGEGLSALVGVPLMTFYKSIIRVSQPREVVVGGETHKSPDVQLLSTVDSATLAQFPRGIGMTYTENTLPPQTTTYGWTMADDGPDLNTPSTPSVLSYIALLQTGGLFVTDIGLLQGEPGPLNPLQFFRVLVDTGAQASIITPFAAANLNLDLENPDFFVAVCGVGGLEPEVPGFYIDYVRINASGAGGALEFGQAPFIVYDLPAVGGTLEGILGMNFFWNRDVLFDVTPATGTGFLRISNPIPMPYGDFDRDFDVDAADLEAFTACASGPAVIQADPACTWFDTDADGDVDQTDFGAFQACLSGSGVPADVSCGPPW